MSPRIARLRYQCRRGMLELDAILQPFFDHHFEQLSSEDQNAFEQLLMCNDQELFEWFIGSKQPDDPHLQHIIEKIKKTKLR